MKLRHTRNLWIPLLTTVALACAGAAVAQVRYSITDLGSEGSDNLGCAMSLNNQGWTEIMAGELPPAQVDYLFGPISNGRALIDVDGVKTDLGTLGGPDSWMMWGEINDRGQVVGDSETNAPDPNGEDVCGFGTHLTCLPFLWQPSNIRARPARGKMIALPTLGGNNGQASAINDRGQIVGFAENGTVDATCPANTTNDMIDLPVLWKDGEAQALPTVDGNPDGVAYWINDRGEAVGYSGTCTAALHAVSWRHGTPTVLPDLGNGGAAYGINNRGGIAGAVGSADGSTQSGAVWVNGKLTVISLLPGDFGGLATGINDKGQVVGSNYDSNFMWAHAFIWEGNVVTDLNKLLPANSNLFAVMANKINDRGQISGMAIVRSGPDAGSIHAFLATPIGDETGESVADVAATRPKAEAGAKAAAKQLLHRFLLGRFRQ
jgi:probable HAF family extracellular repeat protein